MHSPVAGSQVPSWTQSLAEVQSTPSQRLLSMHTPAEQAPAPPLHSVPSATFIVSHSPVVVLHIATVQSLPVSSQTTPSHRSTSTQLPSTHMPSSSLHGVPLSTLVLSQDAVRGIAGIRGALVVVVAVDAVAEVDLDALRRPSRCPTVTLGAVLDVAGLARAVGRIARGRGALVAIVFAHDVFAEVAAVTLDAGHRNGPGGHPAVDVVVGDHDRHRVVAHFLTGVRGARRGGSAIEPPSPVQM